MTSAADVLAIARNEIGYKESPSGSNRTKYGQWYGLNGEPWCAMFVSWVFDKAGLRLPASTSKGFAYTPAGAAWFKRQGKWLTNISTKVTPGMVVFFYWPSMGRIAHVGIVEEVKPNGDLVCIEGNTDAAGGRTGGQVMRRVRSRQTVHQYGGFGIPAFGSEEGLDMTKDELIAILDARLQPFEEALEDLQTAIFTKSDEKAKAITGRPSLYNTVVQARNAAEKAAEQTAG